MLVLPCKSSLKNQNVTEMNLFNSSKIFFSFFFGWRHLLNSVCPQLHLSAHCFLFVVKMLLGSKFQFLGEERRKRLCYFVTQIFTNNIKYMDTFTKKMDQNCSWCKRANLCWSVETPIFQCNIQWHSVRSRKKLRYTNIAFQYKELIFWPIKIIILLTYFCVLGKGVF